MSESMPDAPTLLAAAVKYLEEDLLPALSGYHRFQTRVTVNVLNILRRELELREAQSRLERARLAALLGHDGETHVLSAELSNRIRASAFALDDPDLRAHIRQSLADALAVNNPKWPDR